MEIDKETQQKIQELQSYEQTLQALLMQKQTFQIEINETENALSEIIKTKDDVFKIVGNIMIKTNKESVEKELKEKQNLLSLRLKSIDKQETELTKELESLKDEVMKKIK
jgi:prefoldin beta subunit